MVVQDKKTGEIRICVDLRKLNDGCMHDPFPTPFTDEVLEGIGGQESVLFYRWIFWLSPGLQRKTATKPHLSLNGVAFNTQ